MTDLRIAAQQALGVMMTYGTAPQMDAARALRAALAEEALQRLTDVHQEIEAALEQPDRAQRMRDAGYTRRPKLREMSKPEQPEQESKWRLSCGCPSQHGGILAEWPEITRGGDPAVAYGTVCERHWHKYEARCPNCASLEAQNTELDCKLADLEEALKEMLSVWEEDPAYGAKHADKARAAIAKAEQQV